MLCQPDSWKVGGLEMPRSMFPCYVYANLRLNG